VESLSATYASRWQKTLGKNSRNFHHHHKTDAQSMGGHVQL